MNCPKCGVKNRNTAAFCLSCGFNLTASESYAPPKSPDEPIVTAVIAPESRPKDTAPVTLQNGRYKLKNKIGSGGMGCVFLATDTRMKCQVVVKEMFNMSVDPDENAYMEKRFQEEARTLFKLKHPYLPKVTDFFTENNNMYMIMEYVEGENFETVILKRKDKGITINEFNDWMDESIDIISYLHDLEPPVIHRDIKPANLMLTSKGKVFLVDFGVARSIGEGTKTHTRVGTFGFASPEHYSGRFTLASDIYSLGATFHYLLSGDDPQGRDPFDYPPLSRFRSDIPDSLQMIFDKMLARNKSERYENLQELKKDFNEYISGGKISKSKKTSDMSAETGKMKQAKKTGEMEDEMNISTIPVEETIRPERMQQIDEDRKIDRTLKVSADVVKQPEKARETKKIVKKSNTPMVVIAVLFLLVAGFFGLRGMFKGSANPPPTVIETQTDKITPPVKPTDSKIDQPLIVTSPKKPETTGNAASSMEEGDRQLKLGNYLQAIRLYNEATKYDSRFIPAYLGKARALAGKKDYELAYEEITKAIGIDPNNSEIYITRGDISDGKGNIGIALDDYDKAVSVDPENVTAYIKRGKANVKMTFMDKALEDFNKALKLAPENGKAYIARGEYYKSCKEYNPAIKDYESALRFEDSKPAAYNGMGDVYLEQGKNDKAFEYFNKALEVDPDYAEAINNKGVCYYNRGEFEQAISEFTRAIELEKSVSDYFYNRARAYQEIGENQKAIKDFNEAISINPEEAVIYAYRGQSYYELGKSNEAVTDFEKAMKLNPSLPEAHNNMGVIHLDKGDLEKATMSFSEAIKLKPDYTLAYFHRAESYFARFEYDKARKDWEKVISLDPDGNLSKTAETRIKELEKM